MDALRAEDDRHWLPVTRLPVTIRLCEWDGVVHAVCAPYLLMGFRQRVAGSGIREQAQRVGPSVLCHPSGGTRLL